MCHWKYYVLYPCFCIYFSQESRETDTIITILEMRKLNHRDVKWPAHSHTVQAQRSWNSTQSDWALHALSNKPHCWSGILLTPLLTLDTTMLTINGAWFYRVQVVVPEGAFNSIKISLIGSLRIKTLSVLFATICITLNDACTFPFKKGFRMNEWIRLVTSL